MRRLVIIMLIAVVGFSCKTGNSLSKEEVISSMNTKIESSNYTFSPQTALPVGGKSINLNYSYSLKVSKDTISAYLPYFGRAYSAPMSPDDSGIKFTSTNFDYTVSGKNKGMWNVTIRTKDTPRKFNLILRIGDTGYATLTVNENNRQPVSFYGKIE